MLKGSKEALTVLIVTHAIHVEMVKSSVLWLLYNTVYRVMLLILLMSKGLKGVFVAYIHNIDTFNAMSKGSKDYVMLKQGSNTFLLITFLIFNRFSIRKKFWKAET